MKKIITLLFALILTFSVFAIPVNAESASITVSGNSVAPTFAIGSKKVFCVEPKVNHPKTGVVYETFDGSVSSESEIKAILSNMNDYDPVVIQYALWSVIDTSVDYEAKLKVLKGSAAVEDFNSCKIANENVNVSLIFYKTTETDKKGAEYQKMITAILTVIPTTTTTTVTTTTTTTTPSETITKKEPKTMVHVDVEGTEVSNPKYKTTTTRKKDVEVKGYEVSPSTGDTGVSNTTYIIVFFIALAGCIVALKSLKKGKK